MSERDNNRVETTPGVEGWSRLALDLGATQARNEAGLGAVADEDELIAALCEQAAAAFRRRAERSRALARSVPDGDQAAADFGSVAHTHDLNGVRANVTMGLGLLREGLERSDGDHDAVVALRAEVAPLVERVGVLTTMVGRIVEWIERQEGAK